MAFAYRDEQGIIHVLDSIDDSIRRIARDGLIVEVRVPHGFGFPVFKHSEDRDDYSYIIARPYCVELQHRSSMKARPVREDERLAVEDILFPIIRALDEHRYDCRFVTEDNTWFERVYAMDLRDAKNAERVLAELQAQEKKTLILFTVGNVRGSVYHSTKDYTEDKEALHE